MKFKSAFALHNVRAQIGALAVLSFVGGYSALAQQPTPQAGATPPARRSPFVAPSMAPFDDHEGWTPLFDGKSLDGWDGPSDIWKVQDDAIIGEFDGTHPRPTTYLIWKKGGEHANFELKLDIKVEGTGANGGVQIRSVIAPPPPADPAQLAAMTPEQKTTFMARQELSKPVAKWNMRGPQPDFDWGNRYTGNLYEQGTGRGEIAYRGQIVETQKGKKPVAVGLISTPDELKGFIRVNDWNQWHIIADGNTITQMINGHVMSVFIDNDPTFSVTKGLIGLEIEGGGYLKISHKNIYIKDLP
jgi:Domain of Unknown Function (DUF1080)